jgi:hypothetical protein
MEVKVYVVMSGDYESYGMDGIYASLEAAKRAVDPEGKEDWPRRNWHKQERAWESTMSLDHVDIEEHEVQA